MSIAAAYRMKMFGQPIATMLVAILHPLSLTIVIQLGLVMLIIHHAGMSISAAPTYIHIE